MDNENKLRTESAKWYAGEVSKMAADKQHVALNAKAFSDFRAAFGGNAQALWEAREAFRSEAARGNRYQIRHSTQTSNEHDERKPSNLTLGSAAAGVAVMATSPLGFLRRDNYDKLQKNVTKRTTAAEKYWDEQEKKFQEELKKNPSLKRPEGMARSREEAAERVRREALDTYTRIHNNKVKKWSQENPNDLHLAQSIDRIELEKKDLTYEEFNKIRSRYSERAGKGLEASESEENRELAAKRMLAASNEMNDRMVRFSEKDARKWAKESGDQGLLDAIERKRQQDIEYARKNQGRISKALGRDPAARFAPLTPTALPHTSPSPARAPLPPASRPGGPKTQKRGSKKRVSASGLGKKAASLAARNPVLAFWIAVGAIAGIAIIGLIVAFWVAVNYSCEHWTDDPIKYAPLALLGSATGLCTLEGVAQVDVSVNPPGVTAEIEGPSEAVNNADIEYTITVKYDPTVLDAPPLDKVNVYVVALYEHQFVSATGKYDRDKDEDGNAYTWWNLQDNYNGSNDFEFKLILHPSNTNFVATISIYASDKYIPVTIIVPGSTGGGDYTEWDDSLPAIDNSDINAGRDHEPTHYTCGGKYTDIMNAVKRNFNSTKGNRMFGTGTNFGDPVCSFTRPKLKKVIAQYEKRPAYQDFYYRIARCESPNITGPNAFSNLNNTTQWGHFQMGRSNPRPGKPYEAGNVTRGDLPWQRQVQVAIERNKTVNSDRFNYWQAAQCLCSFSQYATQPYCSYLTSSSYIQSLKNQGQTLRGQCNQSCTDVAQSANP